MTGVEKRRHRRLGVNFELSCRKVNSKGRAVHVGRAVNASPGGLYFETDSDGFETGNILQIELSLPPKTGQFEQGGKISGFAKVLRTHGIDWVNPHADSDISRYGVALEFCRSPKFYK